MQYWCHSHNSCSQIVSLDVGVWYDIILICSKPICKRGFSLCVLCRKVIFQIQLLSREEGEQPHSAFQTTIYLYLLFPSGLGTSREVSNRHPEPCSHHKLKQVLTSFIRRACGCAVIEALQFFPVFSFLVNAEVTAHSKLYRSPSGQQCPVLAHCCITIDRPQVTY